MRFPKRQPEAQWVTYTSPAIRTGDQRTIITLLGVWLGFAAAIHSADSSRIYAAVDRFNHAVDRLRCQRSLVLSIRPPLRKRSIQNEPGSPLGIGRRKQQTHRPALGNSEQERALRSHVVKDGVNVLHTLFKRRHTNNRV